MQLLPFQAMSGEQLSALLAKLNEDAGLREALQGAGTLRCCDGNCAHCTGLRMAPDPPECLSRPILKAVIYSTRAMSDEQLKAFLEAVKTDTGLQEKLKAAADPDTVVAIAQAAGFAISAIDLKRTQSEVSEEELEGVTGGSPILDITYSWSGCIVATCSACAG